MDISTLPKLTIRGSIAPKELSFFDEEVFSAEDAAKFLDQHKNAPTIVIEYFSPGGYVEEGMRIYDLLVASGKEIISIGFRVNSIAVVPFLAGTQRYVTPNCEFWIHNARIDPLMLGIDVLTADDCLQLAESIEATDEKILAHYAKVLGTSKINKISKLMKEETNLGSEGAIKYGFADDLWEGQWADIKAFKVKNYVIEKFLINKITNNQNMANDEEVKKHGQTINKILNVLKNMVRTGKMKNEIAYSSGDKTIIVLTDDETQVAGKKAVYADADGLPTDELVPPGEYPVDGGKTLVVGENGLVTVLKDGADVEALKTEITNWKTKSEDWEKKYNDLKKDSDKVFNDFKTATNLKITELETAFENFKNEVPGDPDDEKTQQDFKKKIENKRKEGKKVSQREILQEMSREKFQNKK